LPKLEFDIAVKDVGLKELNKLIREQAQLTSELIMQYGKESDAAKKAGAALGQLKNEKREVVKATTELSGGIKRSSAQLLEMGENVTVVLAGIKSVAGGIFNFGKTAITSAADFEELRSHFVGAEKDIYNFQKATSFTVGKSDLIKLSNQASDLGIELSKQPMFFLLAKTAAEKYGTDLSTAFQSVIMATEGNIRGLKQIGVQKEVYKKLVEELTQSMGGEVETTQSLNGEQEIQIKNLDPLVQKNIRLEAILKATGVTMNDVNNKTQSNADKLAQLDLLIPQVKKQFGELLASGIIPVTDGLKNAEGTFNSATVAIAGVTLSLGELLPAMAATKYMAGGLFVAIGTWAGALAGLVAQIGIAVNAWNQLKMAFSGNWAQTIGGKLYGLDQTNTEKNSQNETGIFEGIKNRFKQLSDVRNKFAETISKEKTNAFSNVGNTGRGGKSPIQQETEDVEKLAKAMMDLKVAYEQTTDRAQTFIEPLGMSAYSKVRPADQFSGAQSPIGQTMEGIINSVSEPFKEAASSISNIFSDMMNTLGLETDSFVGRLVSGFDTVLSIVNMIVNTLNAVNAVKGLIGGIMSLIPGGGLIANAATAMGGTPGGMPMPMLQGGNMRPIVNVVVQSEVEKTKAIKFFDNNFNAYQNYLRSNSY